MEMEECAAMRVRRADQASKVSLEVKAISAGEM